MSDSTVRIDSSTLEPDGLFLWWQKGTVYQIYPRSFMDADGDGVGDLAGILRRLDYLKDLGVDAIWISPIFPSPMADFGYDVADYCGIHPLFGTMADFDRLLEQTHSLGMKLLLDLVPNHSSEEHPWFKESRSSRENPKRDWYLWQDAGPDGEPPNNWLSVFGGSAWQWDEGTGQFYYHAFLKEQPDLNWRNPDVQKAMMQVLRFWLDKGVDGFRVDVMWHMIKDARFRDNPPNPDYKEGMSPYKKLIPAFSSDQPEVHEIVRLMRSVMDEYDERVLIGEIYLPISKLVTYYGDNGSGAHLPFNFQLVELPWDAERIGAAIAEYEGALPPGGWPNWVLGNHDKSRIASRAGAAQARVAAMLLLTLRGTPTMYYGDELGMQDVPIPRDRIQDPPELNYPGLGLGRDPERTPMQWDASENAGFTTGDPWLPLADDAAERNVEVLQADDKSILSLYHRLLSLRRERRALSVGRYEHVASTQGTLVFKRYAGNEGLLVALNLTHEPHTIKLDGGSGAILLATDLKRSGERVDGTLRLAADEGVIIAL